MSMHLWLRESGGLVLEATLHEVLKNEEHLLEKVWEGGE